jgi:hypothetical protein
MKDSNTFSKREEIKTRSRHVYQKEGSLRINQGYSFLRKEEQMGTLGREISGKAQAQGE